ncbi:MAG TPA: hydrogenase maturation nickel metallochaperone HypA [Candidatus Binataceae bacterium]|nr:hydrogenase maturation nickel metallochaperone HypA [Candidatus Binataceae bacterium]
MHELSVCRGILDAAERALDDFPSSSQVVRIIVRVGAQAHLTRDGLEYYFDLLKLGTNFSDTRLIVEEASRGRCDECTAELSYDELSLICLECGSGSIDLGFASEIEMVAIEVVEEPAQR